MLNRWIESADDGSLLQETADQGMGVIAFSALAQGLLTDRYLDGVPAGSRASRPGSFDKDLLNDEVLQRIGSLNQIAADRGQSLAQLRWPGCCATSG